MNDNSVMETHDDEILFENLEYGAYIIEYEHGKFEENVQYGSAQFNKLHVRRVRLPGGKSNIVYLLTKNFDRSIEMVKNKYFITPPSYRRFFYPWWYIGTFMGRRYKMDVTSSRLDRNKIITSNTKLRPIATRTIPKGSENLFFDCSDTYSTAVDIMKRFAIKRCYSEFYSEFTRIIREMSPENGKGKDDPNWNNRILIVDAEGFGFDSGAPLKDNKTNPLFLLYLAFLRTRDLSKLGVDQDMMICSQNMFIKFNPMHINMKNWQVFRRAMFRIMGANLDEYEQKLTKDELDELDITEEEGEVSAVIQNAVEPFVQNVTPSTRAVVIDAVESSIKKRAMINTAIASQTKKAQKEIADKLGKNEPLDEFQKALNKPTTGSTAGSLTSTVPLKVDPLQAKRDRLFKYVIGGYKPLAITSTMTVDDEDDDFERPDDMDDIVDTVKADAIKALTQDEDVAEVVMDEVQDKIVPMKNPRTAPVSSARDRKLREEQKKIVVKGSSIEQILERDATNVPIQSSDKSAVMHTSNQNMHKIKFANFDKTYIDELYMKHLVACFDMLKDKDSPFYITGVEIKDTSDIMNYQETWTIHLTDENKKRHTIKVDIPKFQDDRFMYFRGTKWIILKQNFYNPLVKDTPDTVILTTNFNKITIKRKANKSLSTVERIFSLVKKTGDSKTFVTGDSSRGNVKYISTLEYDEIARRLFKFSTDTCELFFSRDYIEENLSDSIPKDIKGKEFYIGQCNGTPVLINEDTGLDRQGRTIANIIEDNLPQEYQSLYSSIKAPKQLMYVEGKLAGQFIPIVTTLIVWIGITNTLNRMGITWKFDPNAKRIPAATPSKKYIRFADGVLEYEAKISSELILNGLIKMHPEQFRFSDFDTEVGYEEFIYSQWGSYNGITQLRNFYEFLVDPITKNVCKDMLLPEDAPGLLIRAVELLSDNAYVSKASDLSYRVRSTEMIPGILYACIAEQYQKYVASGRRVPMTINQRCVITRLVAEKTVEAYSTLNPVIEVSKTHTISTKGYKGSNSDHSYDEKKRSYDPTSVGKLAISTSAKCVGRVKLLELLETP